jgi:hypothetical protein
MYFHAGLFEERGENRKRNRQIAGCGYPNTIKGIFIISRKLGTSIHTIQTAKAVLVKEKESLQSKG